MAIKSGENPNHPVKGSTTKVEPIREKKAIGNIKKILADKPRDLAMFVVGINTAFRASDLSRITVGDVRGVEAGGELELREKKTGKARRVTLNGACVDVIGKLLEAKPGKDHEPLFRTNRGGSISIPYFNNLVKQWCGEVGLKGRYGSHTLRKTWGFHQRKSFHVPLPILMEAYGHSTQRQTLDYLCVQAEEIKDVYGNEL